MKPKRRKVWTLDQRAKLAETMRRKHAIRRGELAAPSRRNPLTPSETAEVEAEQREMANAARDFVYQLRCLACEHVPVHPVADSLFRECGVTDAAKMRELAEWTFIISLTPDDIERRIELEVARRTDPRFAEESGL